MQMGNTQANTNCTIFGLHEGIHSSSDKLPGWSIAIYVFIVISSSADDNNNNNLMLFSS